VPRVLECPKQEEAFLRGVLESAQGFVRDEMRDAPSACLPMLEKEDHAFRDLLEALDTGLVLEPNADAQRVLGNLLACIDNDNDYKRVVGEHQALMHLLQQIVEVEI
jgi:hypothetical protein